MSAPRPALRLQKNADRESAEDSEAGPGGVQTALSRLHFGDKERSYALQDSCGTPNVGLGSILSMVA